MKKEKPFEWVDITTSDVCFRAKGKNLSDAFANAGLALSEVIVNTKQIKQKVSRRIALEALDLKQLMFKWLTELIYYQDAENLAFSKFNVKVDEKKLTLNATVRGEEMDQARHETRTHVKACTYHKMEIKKGPKGWTAQVILDI